MLTDWVVPLVAYYLYLFIFILFLIKLVQCWEFDRWVHRNHSAWPTIVIATRQTHLVGFVLYWLQPIRWNQFQAFTPPPQI